MRTAAGRPLSLIVERNARADAAYELALKPARLPVAHPARVPYPIAMTTALAAYDSIIAEYQTLLWPKVRAA